MGSTLSVTFGNIHKESGQKVRIKSESHRPLHVICKDPQGGDKIGVIPVSHNSQTYILQTKDRICGKGTIMRLAVIWKTTLEHGFKVYKAKEFHIDSHNPQGYKLTEVIIKDGPVENTFRLRLHYRVTHLVDKNLRLTSKQKFHIGLACPDRARPKRDVTGRLVSTRLVTLYAGKDGMEAITDIPSMLGRPSTIYEQELNPEEIIRSWGPFTLRTRFYRVYTVDLSC